MFCRYQARIAPALRVCRDRRLGSRSHISESGDEPWREVDCNAVVRTALANLEGGIAESNAVITCGPQPRIRAIQILLLQLFQNLLSNALKYRADGRTARISDYEQHARRWSLHLLGSGQRNRHRA